MRQRGRKAQTDIKPAPISTRRPAPPAALTPAQAGIWQSVTGCYPADYFRKSEHDLLAMYCKHMAESWRVSQLIDTLTDDYIKEADSGIETYAKLLKMRDTETRAATALARSMRITHQSRVHKDSAGRMVETTHEGGKPWEAA